MFEDYASEVVRDYKLKCAKGTLLTNLMHPTPAKLKRECLIVFEKRYLKKDEVILSSFFEPRQDKDAYRLAIKKHERDKFRPLNDILKNGERKTDEKNIELLAWLIDYPQRPYRQWVDDGEPAGTEALEKEKFGLKILKQKRSWLTKKVKITISFAVTLSLGLIGYTLWPKTETNAQPRPFVSVIHHGKCMYWAGDHFTLGTYEMPHKDTPAFPVDTFQMAKFRRITDLNTIGVNAIRKVWYAKIKGQLEIFTQPGIHPVDTNRRLLPLTEYMFNKYIRPTQH
jgi:hypothetical protein